MRRRSAFRPRDLDVLEDRVVPSHLHSSIQGTAYSAYVPVNRPVHSSPYGPNLATSSPWSQTYLALGDSLAFGETDYSQDPSNGVRGYVAQFGAYLASRNGGIAPEVIDLGVDGETSSSFLQGGTPGNGFVAGQPGYGLNTNYAQPFTSQNARLIAAIIDEQAQGRSIGTVTLQIGINDLLALQNSSGYSALAPAQQHAMVAAVLSTFQANDATILGEIHTLLPDAQVYVLGYYPPYPVFQALNQVIQGEAVSHGANYVNVYAALAGHYVQDTSISSGNFHPNARGYNAIAARLEATAASSS